MPRLMPQLIGTTRYQDRTSFLKWKRSKKALLLRQAADDLRMLLGTIFAWMSENSNRVAKVFICIDEGIELYVVGKSEEYDYELRKHLTEFTLSCSQDGTAMHGSVIPNGTREELQAFFDVDSALQLSTEESPQAPQ